MIESFAYEVRVRRRRLVVFEDEATLRVDAYGPEEAQRLAEAQAAYGPVAWEPETRGSETVDSAQALREEPLDQPVILPDVAHGLVAACGECNVRQNGIPASGPWRCRACGQVNQRPTAAGSIVTKDLV